MLTSKTLKLTKQIKDVLKVLEYSGQSIFLSGRAGTGKSSIINHFIMNSKKNVVVVAPTGLAALNVGGQTIHSFFKFPPQVLTEDNLKKSRENIYKKMHTLIIDEVSMVRSDMMDMIDKSLRLNRGKHFTPFGGVQVVFVGDLFQLPPVVRAGDREYIRDKYGSEYFFDAPVFKQMDYVFVELDKVFRQNKDQEQFKEILNRIRTNHATKEDLQVLNSRITAHSSSAVHLTSINASADRLNNSRLNALPDEPKSYRATVKGKYQRDAATNNTSSLDNKFPASFELTLKPGAKIMMVKNEPNGKWVNGSLGEVLELHDDYIRVKIGTKIFAVEPSIWEEYKHTYDPSTEGVEKQVVGDFEQYPIKLAYAMTIHKSQGKTFDELVVDLGRGAFVHGQLYVALSRSRSLEGITLTQPVSTSDIMVDDRVVEYYEAGMQNMITLDNFFKIRKNQNASAVKNLKQHIKNKTTAAVTYENKYGQSMDLELGGIRYCDVEGFVDEGTDYIKAKAEGGSEAKVYKIERILECN